MANFLYVPAHKNICFGGSSTATAEADYDPDWLVDGRPGRPVRSTGTSQSASITGGSTGVVSLVAVINHNVNVAITVGGGVSGTIAAQTAQPNGIFYNGFTTVTPASVGGFSISCAGNDQAVIIGEVIGGEYTSLTLPYYSSDELSHNDFARSTDIDLASIPPYDAGLSARTWSCTWPILTQSEVNGLIAAKDAQRAGTRPTLVVRLSSVNDAMCGFITELQYAGAPSVEKYEVSMTFEEIPRVRWIG